MMIFSFSRFFFTHHVDPIIEEVDLDTDAMFGSMVIQVYDPPPFCAYVYLLEKKPYQNKRGTCLSLEGSCPC